MFFYELSQNIYMVPDLHNQLASLEKLLFGSAIFLLALKCKDKLFQTFLDSIPQHDKILECLFAGFWLET